MILELQTMTYHNLVRNFEGAEHRASFKPGPHSVAHVFSRDGRTICALYLTRPVPPETLAIDGDVPLTVQDLFGRTERLEPSQAALISATLDPVVLLFDREVPRLHDPAEAVKVLRSVAGGAVAGAVPRETPTAVRVVLPGVFPRAFEAQVDGTVDGTWPQTERQTVPVPAGAPAETALSVRLVPAAPAGTHTYRVTVSEGARKIGLLAAPLTVSDLVTVRVDTEPLAPDRDPAIVVTLRNLGAAPRSGTLRLATEHFGDPPPARAFEQPYALPPQGETVARFALPCWQVNSAASYPVQTVVEDAGSRFRLSLAAIDRDVPEEGWGTMSAVQLGGFNLNVDAQPAKWREFVLIEPVRHP